MVKKGNRNQDHFLLFLLAKEEMCYSWNFIYLNKLIFRSNTILLLCCKEWKWKKYRNCFYVTCSMERVAWSSPAVRCSLGNYCQLSKHVEEMWDRKLNVLDACTDFISSCHELTTHQVCLLIFLLLFYYFYFLLSIKGKKKTKKISMFCARKSCILKVANWKWKIKAYVNFCVLTWNNCILLKCDWIYMSECYNK